MGSFRRKPSGKRKARYRGPRRMPARSDPPDEDAARHCVHCVAADQQRGDLQLRGRAVGPPSFLVEALDPHVAGLEPNDHLLRSPDGGPLQPQNFYKRRFKPAVHRALPEELHTGCGSAT